MQWNLFSFAHPRIWESPRRKGACRVLSDARLTLPVQSLWTIFQVPRLIYQWATLRWSSSRSRPAFAAALPKASHTRMRAAPITMNGHGPAQNWNSRDPGLRPLASFSSFALARLNPKFLNRQAPPKLGGFARCVTRRRCGQPDIPRSANCSAHRNCRSCAKARDVFPGADLAASQDPLRNRGQDGESPG